MQQLIFSEKNNLSFEMTLLVRLPFLRWRWLEVSAFRGTTREGEDSEQVQVWYRKPIWKQFHNK